MGLGEKISYMKVIDGWDWVIGTGFYVERFQKHLADSVEAIQKSNQDELHQIFFIYAPDFYVIWIETFFANF